MYVKSSQVKSSKFHHYLTFCVMVLLAGCQNPKNELLPQEVRNGKTTETSQNSFRTVGDSIFQKNGRLVFKDSLVFRNTIGNLSNMSDEEKQIFESRFENYVSWRKHNQDCAGNDNILALYFDTASPSLPSFFTALVNSKREYQIGKTIFYLEEGKTFEIPENQENSLKQEGWFKASTLANFQTNSLRTVGDGKYQYQYWRSNTEYKHVFEAARFQANGYTALYIVQKLEYWGWVTWFRKDWRAAGELRGMNIVSVVGTCNYSNFLTRFIPRLPSTSKSLSNVRTYNELVLFSYVGNNANINLWTYSFTVDLMDMFVPSHGQVSVFSGLTGAPKLIVPNAFFIR